MYGNDVQNSLFPTLLLIFAKSLDFQFHMKWDEMQTERELLLGGILIDNITNKLYVKMILVNLIKYMNLVWNSKSLNIYKGIA